jgi:hypothetical protein
MIFFVRFSSSTAFSTWQPKNAPQTLGVNQDNPQRNFILGTEVVPSANSRNSFVFEYAKAVVHVNGPSLGGFAVKYDYAWGKGYR